MRHRRAQSLETNHFYQHQTIGGKKREKVSHAEYATKTVP
jgi:hypothetical protein